MKKADIWLKQPPFCPDPFILSGVEGLIQILFIDCRLTDSVIPAKAAIQSFYVYYMQFFRQFLTVIGINPYLRNSTFLVGYSIFLLSILIALRSASEGGSAACPEQSRMGRRIYLGVN